MAEARLRALTQSRGVKTTILPLHRNGGSPFKGIDTYQQQTEASPIQYRNGGSPFKGIDTLQEKVSIIDVLK